VVFLLLISYKGKGRRFFLSCDTGEYAMEPKDIQELLNKAKLIPSLGSANVIQTITDSRQEIEDQILAIRPSWQKPIHIPEWDLTITLGSVSVLCSSTMTWWPKDVDYGYILDHPNIKGMDTRDLTLSFEGGQISVGDIQIKSSVTMYVRLPEDVKDLLRKIGNITTNVSSYLNDVS